MMHVSTAGDRKTCLEQLLYQIATEERLVYLFTAKRQQCFPTCNTEVIHQLFVLTTTSNRDSAKRRQFKSCTQKEDSTGH